MHSLHTARLQPRASFSCSRLRAAPRASTWQGRRTFACGAAEKATVDGHIRYDRILLAVLDANPQLSDGSKQAIAAAAQLAQQHSSKVTALVVDMPGAAGDTAEVQERTKLKCDNISWEFKERGTPSVDVVEAKVGTSKEESGSSAIVGDVADEVNADIVILSSEAVHAKHVDANLLAEFVPCPVLLLP